MNSETKTDMEGPGVAGRPASKARIWTGRVISALVVAFMLLDAVMKLIKPPPVVKSTVELGFPENTISGIGLALLISVILYAIPRTALFGAMLVTAYLGGAVCAMVRVNSPIYMNLFPILFAVLAWAGLAMRDERLWRLVFRCPDSAQN
jgi:hypothetical protein